jgi:sugar transferase (PEP-CTERM/EpsH1 system associated)
MNVLWLSQNIPYPPKTGVLQRNYNLLREAAKRANVYLLAVFKRDILPGEYDIETAKRELGKLCRVVEIVDLPIESSRFRLYNTAVKSLFTSDPFSVNWIKDVSMRQQLRRMLDAVKFDLVHVDTISLAAYHDELREIPKILNHHNIESHLLIRRTLFEKNPIKRWYLTIESEKLRRYEQRVCGKFDTNFTVSELDKQRLLEIVQLLRVDVIANGVDVEYFSPREKEIVPGNLIMVSGMNWFPNRDAALYMAEEIWPLLSEHMPELSWMVVGSDPPQQLLDLALRDQRVVVTGFVNDVRPYLSQAEIYLCPMRDGGGTRLKILDALAMEKAIVCTTMACEGIAVTPEKNVLIADSPQEFLKQIRRLRQNPLLRESLGKAAREFVIQQYSWEKIGRDLETVYQTVVKAKAN